MFVGKVAEIHQALAADSAADGGADGKQDEQQARPTYTELFSHALVKASCDELVPTTNNNCKVIWHTAFGH